MPEPHECPCHSSKHRLTLEAVAPLSLAVQVTTLITTCAEARDDCSVLVFGLQSWQQATFNAAHSSMSCTRAHHSVEMSCDAIHSEAFIYYHEPGQHERSQRSPLASWVEMVSEPASQAVLSSAALLLQSQPRSSHQISLRQASAFVGV